MTQKEVFSANLTRILEENGEKQVDLARHLGVSTAVVCEWCKGRKMPKIDKIGAIIRHFGCKYSDLLGTESVDEDEDTMFLFFRALTNKGKEKALSYVSFLLGEEAKARHAAEEADHAEP